MREISVTPRRMRLAKCANGLHQFPAEMFKRILLKDLAYRVRRGVNQ